MATPVWNGASTGSQPLASQVNQFLGSHQIQYIYQGVPQNTSIVLGSGGVNSNGLYIAQSFTTTSAYNLGRVNLDFSAMTGNPTATTTISIQTNSGSAPSGTALVAAVSPALRLNNGVFSTPVPCSLAASTTYWIVMSAVGDVSNYITWLKTTAVSGASTSTNGTTWTAQGYGLYFTTFDQTPGPPLGHTWEDGGARWTTFTAPTPAQVLLGLKEYTTGQAAGDYVYSSRTLTYDATNTNLTFVT